MGFSLGVHFQLHFPELSGLVEYSYLFLQIRVQNNAMARRVLPEQMAFVREHDHAAFDGENVLHPLDIHVARLFGRDVEVGCDNGNWAFCWFDNRKTPALL